MTVNRVFKSAAVIFALAIAAGAQTGTTTPAGRIYREGNSWIEEITGTMPAARNVRVDTQAGSVTVQGGTPNVVYVLKKRVTNVSEERARREFETFRFSVSRQGETVLLRGEYVSGGSHRMSPEFRIQAPRDTDLVAVQTRGGSVGVNNIAGRVDAETAGGSITADQIGGVVNARTMGGSIDLGSSGSDAVLKSAGGSIHAETVVGKLIATTYGGSMAVGTVKQMASLETMGGSISIRSTGGDLRATTAGGNVDAGEVGGAAYLKTAGGNIRLTSARGAVDAATAGGGISLYKLERGARAETAAGGITAEFLGRAMTDSVLETTAGDIVVFLKPQIACSVRAAIEMASGHKIRSDFPELKISTEGAEYGPREWFAQGMLNGGGPLLKLRTSIGDIEIRKASASGSGR
jgi:hypothetical protein